MKKSIARSSWISERKSCRCNGEETINPQMCRRMWRYVLKEKWHQELQDIEQRRSDLLPGHGRMQKRSQKLQSLHDKKKQCQKNLSKWAEDNERLRNVIPQQACTTMFFLFPKNVTSERPIALMPTLTRWWEALRAPEVAKWQLCKRRRSRSDNTGS